MLFRKLIDRKSNHTTWLLAIVIFLSGFSLSLSPAHANTEHAKAKTELVLSSKIKSKKTIFYKQGIRPLASASLQPANLNFIFFQNALDQIQFNVATKTRQDFIPWLTSYHFLFKISEDNTVYALG